MSSLQILNGSRFRFALAALCAAVSLFLAACSGGGSSGGGDTTPPDTTPPAAPAGLGATAAGGSQINLAWTAATDNVGVTGYRVERCQGAGCANFAQVATPAAASFNDTGLSDATPYSYRVRAADAAGNLGAYSNTASATTADTTPPSAPTTLSATAASPTQVDLSWVAATDNVGVTGYQLERCQGASCATFAQIAAPTATSFSDTGVTANTSYSYRARAVDAAANLGPYSNIASASTPLSAPTGVTATPGNGQVTLSWASVLGPVSYNVYTSPTDPATLSGTKINVLPAAATLSSLTNGTPIYAAVTAVNATGESALSKQVCGVPTASSTTGLTLYDPLCESTLDGNKWQTPLFSRGVASNAMELRAQIANAESRTVKFESYQTLASVNTTSRVTTLTADITVPSTTASRSGTGEIRAIVRLSYQPPANRLNFPGGNLDQLLIEIGLRDNGSGLKASRTFRHCDNASCTSRSITGITFVDPAGFTPTTPGQTEAPAAYDTTYTVSVSLDETSGVLTWSFNGGTFSAAKGTADPGVYLAGNANWLALGADPLSTGGGFLSAQLAARVFDDSNAGGSAGAVTGRFANVKVGLNNAPATLYDDFSGASGNSGPTELSAVKWTQPGGSTGNSSAALIAGRLAAHVQGTSPSTGGFRNFQVLNFNDPASVNTLQADMTVTSCANSYGGGRANQVSLIGNFFNDGSAGNAANSNVGEVRASLNIQCFTDVAFITIVRFDTQTTSTTVGSGVFPLGTVVNGNNHKLKMSWDPTAHQFTFQVDSTTTIVVDPTAPGGVLPITTPVTVAGPARSPLKQLVWGVFVGTSPGDPTGATASMDLTVNNVFTAP